MTAHEVNFDGLIGPTHNYAGLSRGNIASTSHKGRTSSPKQAALQGLAKMKLLAELGVKQAVLPPQARPDLRFLRGLGFSGSDRQVIERCAKDAPLLLASAYSASSMWAANAATVSPSADCADQRVHLTPANLISQLHRSIEASETHRVLRMIFSDEARFAVHEPLPPAMHLSDEGAANHTRLCGDFGEPGGPGIEIFTFGRAALDPSSLIPRRYPARQTREASEAIARRHQLEPRRTFFVQQTPEAIDAGVFHNDVIAVGHGNVLLCHERAWVGMSEVLRELRSGFAALSGKPLVVVEVKEAQVSLTDTVRSYLFNSQVVSLLDGSMAIICPIEAMECDGTRRFVDDLLAMDTPIRTRHIVDLRQSMNNGGGPACLRLRVALTEQELKAVHPGVMWSAALHVKLLTWVERHHREELKAEDLRNAGLMVQSRDAMRELSGILGLPGLYSDR